MLLETYTMKNNFLCTISTEQKESALLPSSFRISSTGGPAQEGDQDYRAVREGFHQQKENKPVQSNIAIVGFVHVLSWAFWRP